MGEAGVSRKLHSNKVFPGFRMSYGTQEGGQLKILKNTYDIMPLGCYLLDSLNCNALKQSYNKDKFKATDICAQSCGHAILGQTRHIMPSLPSRCPVFAFGRICYRERRFIVALESAMTLQFCLILGKNSRSGLAR